MLYFCQDTSWSFGKISNLRNQEEIYFFTYMIFLENLEYHRGNSALDKYCRKPLKISTEFPDRGNRMICIAFLNRSWTSLFVDHICGWSVQDYSSDLTETCVGHLLGSP